MRAKNTRLNEQGAIAVITALVLTVLLGFAALVVDIGALYEERRQIQTAVDGAALAGAQELPDLDMADTKAREYLTNNGAQDANNAQITFPNNMTIKVSAAPQTVAFSLAPIMGFNSSTVTAEATAVKEDRIHFVPWALVLSMLTADQLTGDALVVLEGGAGQSTTGNFQAITIPRSDVTGATPTYKLNIELGCENQLAVGDVYNTFTGNRVGPLTEGLTNTNPTGLFLQGSCAEQSQYEPPGNTPVSIDCCSLSCVFGAASGSAITSILEPGCPRIVRVPIIDAWPNGSQPVTITDLTWFFIAEPPPPDSGQVYQMYGYIISGLPASAQPYTIRLIE